MFKQFVTCAAGVSAACIVGLGTTSPVSADTGCTNRSISTPFTAWGDSNRYFTAPGGSFEKGQPDAWSLAGGAAIASGNEPWAIAGTGASSVSLPSGAVASSQTFCVASDEDSLRLAVRKPGVGGSTLHVAVRVTSGVNVATNEVDVDGNSAGWAVSDRIMLPDIRDASGRQYVTVTLSTRNAPATWQVDAVMVDPWRTL